jgi:hypothetical protein
MDRSRRFMTAHRALPPPTGSVLRPVFPRRAASVAEKKARQAAKIMALGDALIAAGVEGLDEQAHALGVCRSTAWTILKAQHKGSGLSANVINKMLAAPDLPPAVRRIILEYVAEKTAGCYGDNKAQLSRFSPRLCPKHLEEARALASSSRDHIAEHIGQRASVNL